MLSGLRIAGVICWILFVFEGLEVLNILQSLGTSDALFDIIWLFAIGTLITALCTVYLNLDIALTGVVVFFIGIVLKSELWDPFVAGFPGYGTGQPIGPSIKAWLMRLWSSIWN